jgi:hypothetical protein
MFEHMRPDKWTDLHRYAMELLRTIVRWNPDPDSVHWRAICPHIARLTRVLQTMEALDGPAARPSDPARRAELLVACAAVAAACDRHTSFTGAEAAVKVAAAQLSAALIRLGEQGGSGVTRRQVARAR